MTGQGPKLCPICQNRGINPLIPTSTACPCGIVPGFLSIRAICRWHALSQDRHANPAWARQHLQFAERTELITAEQAAIIRQECGWLQQLPLHI